jgi:transposase-like protein
MTQARKLVKWQSLFLEQEQSGQSVAAFCRERGVGESLYYYWKKQWKEAAMPQFVEVELTKGNREREPARLGLGSTIEVRLGNGRSLMVAPEFEANHLRAFWQWWSHARAAQFAYAGPGASGAHLVSGRSDRYALRI